MKTAHQIKIALILVSTLFAGLLITALSHGTTAHADTHISFNAPSQVVTITAKRLSIAEKLQYDALTAAGVQNDTAAHQQVDMQTMQTVVISAKRLTNEEKIAMDAAHVHQLQANTHYNALLRKTV
jgi:hypothetical protein